MTTATATKQMIYQDRNVAQMLLGKLQKREPDAKWAMTKLPQGYQLSRVTVLPPQVIKPLPAASNFLLQAMHSDEAVEKLKMSFADPSIVFGEKPVVVENDVSSFVEGVAGKATQAYVDFPISQIGSASDKHTNHTQTFPFLKETKSWLYFNGPQGPGGVKWVHKNHVKSYTKSGTHVIVTMKGKKAKEVGLIG